MLGAASGAAVVAGGDTFVGAFTAGETGAAGSREGGVSRDAVGGDSTDAVALPSPDACDGGANVRGDAPTRCCADPEPERACAAASGR